MKKIICLLAAVLAMIPAARASFRITADSTDVKLADFRVSVDEKASLLRVVIDLDISRYSLGRDREMILTPVLISADRTDSLEMRRVIIAGRNLWYSYVRNDSLERNDHNIFRAGDKDKARIHADLPLLPWMEMSSLEMRAETANCCDTPGQLTGSSPSGNIPLALIDLARPEPSADFIFAPPVDAGPVERFVEGRAFVTFVVNRTNLRDDYMINRSELDKILGSIRYVKNDTDAIITDIHIKGFASPEGPYDNNVRLAQGRTDTLSTYVRNQMKRLYDFSDTIFTFSYEPEDWTGLRRYITDSLDYKIDHRAEIIDIIDGPLGFDNKDLAIKRRFPADYKVILQKIYPWLRHSDYRVSYRIRTYVTLDEIRRAYASDPTRLRNVDFYTLAQSYPAGSPEYCDVFLKAVEVYRDDPMLNLNAANVEMSRGNLDEAQAYLFRAGSSPLADYARALLAYRRENYPKALEYLESARKGGIDCETLMKRVDRMINRHTVTYLIQPPADYNNNK